MTHQTILHLTSITLLSLSTLALVFTLGLTINLLSLTDLVSVHQLHLF